MKRILRALVVAAFLPQLAGGAIDLTPRFIDIFSEGASLRRAYFTDGEKKFTVSLNRETEVVAEAGGARFRFLKLPEVTFLVIRSRHSPDDKFEGQSLDRYRESARRLLPVQAREVVIREELADPYPINDWKGYRFILTYTAAGAPQTGSVTFLNMNPSDQIVLLTLASEKEFGEAAHRSHQIFRTWQEMLPGDEKVIRGI